MHRHGYVGRKLGRKRDERRLLVKNLATSLILDGHVTTTLPKAKTVLPYAERLISKARKADLPLRRQVIAGLLRDDAASKLIDTIAPQLKRDSGFLRLKKAGWRTGDHAELAKVSFVDQIKTEVKAKKKTVAEKKPPAKAKTAAVKPAKPKEKKK